MQQVRAITIDLDDTLWPIHPVILAAEQRLHDWFAAHCPRVTETHTTEDIDRLRRRVMREHPHRDYDFAFLRNEVIAAMLAAAGYDRSLAGPAYDAFFAARNEVVPFDDVEPELDWLAERYTLVAVTNGNADLERIGLAQYFRCTIRAADVGVAKPAAEIFATAVAATGVSAGQVLHIGDAPEDDVAGARGAGLRTAWMNRFGRDWPSGHAAPDLALTSLAELRQALVPAPG